MDNHIVVTSKGMFEYYDNIPALIISGENLHKEFYGDDARKLFEMMLEINKEE